MAEEAHFLDTDADMLVAPGVWALGDVVGHGGFTHMAMYGGSIILSQLLGRLHHRAEYHAVRRVTFTDPEVGAVGITEAQARDRLGDTVQTPLTQLPDSARP